MKKVTFLIVIITFFILEDITSQNIPLEINFLSEMYNSSRPLVIDRDTYQKIGDYENSLQFWSERIEENDFRCYYQMAVNYSKLQKYDSAFYFLNKFIDLQTDNRLIIVDEAFDNLKNEKNNWEKIVSKIEEIHLKKEAKEASNKNLSLELFYLNISYFKYLSYLPLLNIPDSCFIENSDDQFFSKQLKESVLIEKLNENKQNWESRFKILLSKYGYPTLSNSGLYGAETAFLLLNSFDITDDYYSTLEKENEENKGNSKLFAIITDKYSKQKGDKQYYGTQTIMKKGEGKIYQRDIYPVKNLSEVNERRKRVGFQETLEEYRKRLNNSPRTYIE